MGSTRATALFLSVLLLLLPAVFSASLNPITNRATNAIAAGQYLSNAYILELDLSTPGLVKRDSTPDSILTDVLSSIGRNGIKYQLRQRFTSPTLFHGASITVPEGVSRTRLAALRGIKRVWPVRKFSRPRAVVDKDGGGSGFSGRPVEPAVMGVRSGLGKRANAYAGDTFGPHIMTGVNATHEAGWLGAGIKIGVLDTGVDYLNPILGGCFGPGCHLSFGYDLVGDAYDGENSPVPDVDPFASCDPHGTHVTGIIGALPNAFGFTGVAPAATLGHYRIFGCGGFVGEDIILAGLMRGVEDNCNVLTLSLGGSGGWVKGTPASILIDQIEAQGILVTVATGNTGSEGMFFSEAPASTINGLAIASTDVIDLIGYNATVSGQPAIPYLSATPLNVVANSFRVHFTSTDPNNPVDACSPLPAGTPNLANYVTVVQRGSCTFVTKYQNVLNAGGKIVLLYNSEGAGNLPYLTPNGVAIDAVAGLRRSDGLKLLAYSQNGSRLTLRFPKGKIVAGLTDTVSGGLISTYSTFGPTNDLYGQPTLSAPGGNILSTFPLSAGGVAVISGTSMSCPFVAGSAAVLMAARASENLTPLEIRSLLTTTAKLTPVSLAGTTPLVNVIRQGGGLVQVAKALAAKTLISPHELMLNDTANAKYVQTITIKNKNSWVMKYTFTSTVAQGLGTFDASGDILPTLDPAAVSGAQATVTFNTRVLSVAPGATGFVEATIKPPVLSAANAGRFPIFSGWIGVNGQGARDDSRNEAYTVPYFGLAAKMIDMQVLDTTDTIYGPGYAYPFVIDDAIGDIQSVATSYSRNLGPTIFARFAAGTLRYSIDLVLADIAFTPTYPNSSPSTRFVKRSLTQHTSPATQLTKRRVSVAITDRPLYSDAPVAGNIFTQLFTGRDFLVDAAPSGSTDRTVTFNGQYSQNGLAKTAVTGTSYRFLLRALKISGDALYEDQYESWLSLPFSFRA